MTHPLTGAWLKLARAQEHAEQLNQLRERFLSAHPYGIAGHFDTDTSEYVFRIEVLQHPSPSFGLLIGDIVQNLRAALDHIAWEFVKVNGETPDRGTQFPILVDATDYEGKTSGRVKGMSDSAKTFIEKSQPFNTRPNDPKAHSLWLLNELARIDRHQVLHTTTIAVSNAALTPIIDYDIEEITDVGIPITHGEPLKHGAHILRCRIKTSGPNPKMHVDGVSASDVAIEHPELPLLPLTGIGSLYIAAKSVLNGAMHEFGP